MCKLINPAYKNNFNKPWIRFLSRVLMTLVLCLVHQVSLRYWAAKFEPLMPQDSMAERSIILQRLDPTVYRNEAADIMK